jgi:chemotaxis protein MotA
MIPILAYVFILVMVFGAYIMSGGKIEIVLEALPHEMMTIAGGGLGAFVVANKTQVIKGALKGLGKVFKGAKWKEQDYKDILCLLFTLCKLMKSKGMIALEQHIEKPEESTIFKKYPRLLADHFVTELICDTLRTLTMGLENPYQIEDMIEKKLDKHHHEIARPGNSMQTLADGLPAIGIVAAVLGVIKTMASITEPPEILGRMIGGALVGTFLGVFLSYLIVAPMAGKMLQCFDEEHQLYIIIRDVLVSHLKGSAPQISMEIGRGSVPTYYQPSFLDMEKLTSELKIEG